MSNGVSVQAGRPLGAARHAAACPALKRFGVRAAAAPLAAAVISAAVIYLLAAAVAEAAGRGIARAWNRLGARGRLILLMIAAYPLSHGGSELGLLPGGALPAGVSAAVIVTGAGVGLLWLRRSGQREWRESGGRAFGVHHGLQETAEGCAQRYSANAGRLEALEQRIGAIETGLARVGRAAAREDVLPPVAGERPTLVVLRGDLGA